MNNPQFVHRSPLSENEEYIEWLNSIKQRFSKYQTKATVKVNAEMLAFYWSLGRDMVEKNIEKTYGKGIIENLSLDLRRMFNGQSGFSVVNLYYMKRWYAFYKTSNEIFYQAGKKSDMPEIFALVPWRHHIEIMKNCASVDEALFYIQKTIEGNWSRAMLEDNLKSKLFDAQWKALTNFSQSLPVPQGDL